MPELELAAGRVIADRRRRAGHTQESLAEACALHPTYISQLERGLKSPTLGVLVRLAAAMCLAPSALVRGIERELAKPPVAKPPVAKRPGKK
jgi:transcriptional regulator with XRE-family HTH domain